jgi:uncharacterized ferritin-like protein (DUF455 family)
VELSEYARTIVESEDIDEKLSPPPGVLTDESPGESLRILSPGRPAELRVVSARDAPVPPIEGFQDEVQRIRILHACANHELQAVELFAWAILAFPDADPELRSGLLRILREEQMHTRLYRRRLRELGADLGSHPVSAYFWNKIPKIATPVEFLSAMSLTFENANLDHSTLLARSARRVRDQDTAEILDRVHADERGHVRFGWEWLARLKRPEQSMTEAWLASIHWPLRAALARGREFHRESREAIGLDPEFIDLLERASDRDRVDAPSSNAGIQRRSPSARSEI